MKLTTSRCKIGRAENGVSYWIESSPSYIRLDEGVLSPLFVTFKSKRQIGSSGLSEFTSILVLYSSEDGVNWDKILDSNSAVLVYNYPSDSTFKYLKCTLLVNNEEVASKEVLVVENGKDGLDALGISSIENTEISEGTEVTVSLSDNSKKVFLVRKGKDGEKGDKGEKGEKGDKGEPATLYFQWSKSETIFAPRDSNFWIKGESYIYFNDSLLGNIPLSASWLNNWKEIEEAKDKEYKYLWCKIDRDSTPFLFTGSTGNGISAITEYYAVSSSNSEEPSEWSEKVPSLSNENKYLWNYEIVQYTDGSKKEIAKRVIGVYGDKGTDGKNGQNGWSTVVVSLYKRSAEIPTFDGFSLKYTFATTSLSSGVNGKTYKECLGSWLPYVPKGEDPLYVIYACASANDESDIIVTSDWSEPTVLSENGTKGEDGLSVASVILYRSSFNILTEADLPTKESSFNFETGEVSIDSTDTDSAKEWENYIPDATAGHLWVTSAVASSKTSYDTILPSEWTSPKLLAKNGIDGKSAYEVAKEQGYTGTKASWLESLKGKTPTIQYKYHSSQIDNPTSKDWSEDVPEVDESNPYLWMRVSLDDGYSWDYFCVTGNDGPSAYEVAVAQGYTGTENEWLGTLRGKDGPKGDQGLSAYQVALKNGFVGTEEKWLESLKGTNGTSITYDDLTPEEKEELKGESFYTWIVYADSVTPAPNEIYSTSEGRRYVGIASNKDTLSHSTDYRDYNWTKIKAADGVSYNVRGGGSITRNKDGSVTPEYLDLIAEQSTEEGVTFYKGRFQIMIIDDTGVWQQDPYDGFSTEDESEHRWRVNTSANSVRIRLYPAKTKDTSKVNPLFEEYISFSSIGDKGEQGESFTTVIESTNGNIFRPTNINTILSCRVYKNLKEITDELDDSCFYWVRNTGNTDADTSWGNQEKARGHKTITITTADCNGRTVFNCEVDIGE